MPGMDGVEALKELHKEKRGLNYATPVVVLTANAVAGCKDLYLKEGFVDYISKPVDVMKLDRVLRTYLKSSLISDAGTQAIEEKESTVEPGLVHIDRAIGLQYCLDDELYQQVLKSYLEQGQDYKIQVPSHYEAKNWREYAIVAHAIKSSSLSIGAVTLSDLAKEQEFLGKAENEEEISRTYEAFFKEFCETLTEIASMLE